MIELRTKRLRLLALTADQLRLALADLVRLEQQLDLTISRSLLDESVRRACGVKLSKLRTAGQSYYPWYTYWLIVIADTPSGPFGAGLAGFKGLPDDHGLVEVGYGIEPPYRNKGYMTETVQALIAWAFEQPAGVSAVTAETERYNVASGRVLQKAGMEIYAENGDRLSWRIENQGR